jgi:hypothetical protein
MMTKDELIGRHLPGNGQGITGEDLYQLLRQIPRKARENYLMCNGNDVLGLSIGQSDQAEPWEFKLRLVTDGED